MTAITYYTFQGIVRPEALKLTIYPSRQTIYICSTKTNGKFVDASDKFYDSVEEMNKCLAMSQEEFDSTMVKTFNAQGYNFVKKEVVEDADK